MAISGVTMTLSLPWLPPLATLDLAANSSLFQSVSPRASYDPPPLFHAPPYLCLLFNYPVPSDCPWKGKHKGKTMILQQICDTTESPMIYQQGKHGREEVCGPNFVCESDLTDQFKLELSMDYLHLSLFAHQHHASEASTPSMMNLCS